MKLDAIKTVTVLVTVAEADIGTPISQNHRRAIYKIKLHNLFAGPNLLTLGKRENGAIATTVMDYIQTALQYDFWNDPDELKEDSAPLYIVEGPVVTPTVPVVGTSFIRAVGSAGNCYMTLWYADTEAPA